MDSNTILLVILLCVNVISNLFNNGLMTLQVFMKMIKKSTCCGSSLEMRDKTPPNSTFDLTKKNDEQIDVIIEKIRKSVDNGKKD